MITSTSDMVKSSDNVTSSLDLGKPNQRSSSEEEKLRDEEYQGMYVKKYSPSDEGKKITKRDSRPYPDSRQWLAQRWANIDVFVGPTEFANVGPMPFC